MRSERLRNEEQALREFASRSDGLVNVLSVSAGDALEIKLALRMPIAINDRFPAVAASSVEVMLFAPRGYPLSGELKATFLAPVPFHPNVYDGGTICFGQALSPSMTMKRLLEMIAQMMAFESPPTDSRSPANRPAAIWYEAKKVELRFPTRKISFVAIESRSAILNWKDIK